MSAPEREHQTSRSAQGAEDAGRFFRYMANYVGFTPADADAIRQTMPIIAKYLPDIVTDFYTHLLRYPLTRSLFLKPDGTVDEPYLVMRMRHLSNFWLRSAEGIYDDDYARYVDYVGRAHTSHGADPTIYVPERYVIGQVGMMQNAISRAVSTELRDQGDEVEFRAVEAWDKLMMVILELLARAYGHEREPESYGEPVPVDQAWVRQLAGQAIVEEHGDGSPEETHRVAVATTDEIPNGQRKIVQVGELSIGIFHYEGEWHAVRNSCVHQGGPVATGVLEGEILTCPWHGFQFNLRTGACLADPDAELDRYPVTIEGNTIYLDVPVSDTPGIVGGSTTVEPAAEESVEEALAENEFRTSDLAASEMLTLTVNGTTVLVYNVDGTFYATDEACTHAQGPLSAGSLDGNVINCVLHGSCFDVTNGAVLCAPATEPLRTYPVTVEDEIGRVNMI